MSTQVGASLTQYAPNAVKLTRAAFPISTLYLDTPSWVLFVLCLLCFLSSLTRPAQTRPFCSTTRHRPWERREAPPTKVCVGLERRIVAVDRALAVL